MFNQLQDRLSNVVKTLKGQGKISEKNIKNAIRDVRRALLEADVNLKVVRLFIDKVQEQAVGEKVLKSISPEQQFIKIIYDEMVNFLGDGDNSIKYSKSGMTVIVMVGLQGVGKTTTCAKLASFLKSKYYKNPIMIAADVQRPAAIEQLETLGKNINIPVYSDKKNKDVSSIVAKGIAKAKENKSAYDNARREYLAVQEFQKNPRILSNAIRYGDDWRVSVSGAQMKPDPNIDYFNLEGQVPMDLGTINLTGTSTFKMAELATKIRSIQSQRESLDIGL